MCNEEHVHEWVLFLPNAEGYFNKRGEGQDSKTSVEWYRGDAFKCVSQPCDTFLFVPHNRTYSPVECALEVQAPKQAVAA